MIRCAPRSAISAGSAPRRSWTPMRADRSIAIDPKLDPRAGEPDAPVFHRPPVGVLVQRNGAQKRRAARAAQMQRLGGIGGLGRRPGPSARVVVHAALRERRGGRVRILERFGRGGQAQGRKDRSKQRDGHPVGEGHPLPQMHRRAGLDVSVQARLFDLLRGPVRSSGLSAMVLTHDFAVVRLFAQRLAVMKRARVAVVAVEGVARSFSLHPQGAARRSLSWRATAWRLPSRPAAENPPGCA